MIEQAYLFLKFVGVVLKVKFFYDIFFFYSFNIEEVILIISEHFGGIVEVDSDHIIAQSVADPILR
jgi:hypothetical protein